MTGSGQLRILSLPTGQELAPWQLQPGCCGVSGPVPSATLDKRCRKAASKSYQNRLINVKNIAEGGKPGARAGHAGTGADQEVECERRKALASFIKCCVTLFRVFAVRERGRRRHLRQLVLVLGIRRFRAAARRLNRYAIPRRKFREPRILPRQVIGDVALRMRHFDAGNANVRQEALAQVQYPVGCANERAPSDKPDPPHPKPA